MVKLKNRFAAAALAAAVAVAGLPVGGTVTANAQCLDGLTDLGRQVAAEGCVLIKNDNNVLPLEGGVSVSIFGRAQCNYYKSGTGSGGDVKAPYSVGILEGLRKNPKVKVNEDLAKVYADWVANGHGFDNGGGGWAAEPWFQAEMPLEQSVADAAKAQSEVAVVLIGRTAGEDKDGANTAGSYLLTDTEKQMLETVSKTFDKVVVVLNVPAIIDMNWMDDYDVDSVIYTWQGGMNGGDGAADVLTGDVNPSGRLTDTIAKNYSDYPSAPYFGRTDYNYYVEDIYVGYRYFETFAQDAVAYPFGYGLSYTTFETSTYAVTESDGYINVFTTVENTGDRAGKETVQVYYGAPQGTLGNPVKELAAFAKTKLLNPGESQDITLSFKISDMAPYDDSGVTGHDSAYVLEAGDYNIYVGNDVRDSQLEYTYVQKETEVVEQLSEQMAPVHEFDRMKPVEDEDGNLVVGFEPTPTQTVDVIQKIEDNLPKELSTKDDNHYDLIDVYNGKVTTEEFVAQLTNEELTSIVQGEGMSPANVTSGVASAFGGVNTNKDGRVQTLTDLYGIPRAATADGPSGIRQTAAATSLPGGASIACTWNTDLVERMFQLEGQEMVLNNIDSILGPGINLHRNPLNGRNFEYYSEDPLVTGKMAAAVTKGIQSTGATVTIKHFAANNQETNRHYDDSRVSERALRQLYLKCFEIPVKEGKARSLMTSYNPINGLWAASNYDLATEILRNEWGYEGIVMTDWWARMNREIGNSSTTASGVQYLACMVKSQNDLYMVTPDSSTTSAANTSTRLDMAERLESGYITRAELQRSAVNICNYLMKSQAFARLYNLDFEPYFVTGDDWFKVEKGEIGNPRLSSISIGDAQVENFNPYVLEYNAEASADAIPAVSAEAANGEEISIEQATAESPVALIHVTANGEETIYRVIFTLQGGSAQAVMADDIKVNGVSLDGFSPSVRTYAVPLDSDSQPQVTATAAEGIDVKAAYDAASKTATVTCTKDDQQSVYTIYFGSRPQSDEFNGAAVGSQWSIEGEVAENWSIGDGHLTIQTQQGSFYQDQNNAHNQFVQEAFGDWEAVVKLDLDRLPDQNYHSLGIAAKQDDDNYINLKIEWSSKRSIDFTQEINGSRTILESLSESHLAKFTDTVYFRLTKKGNIYSAAVSPDGKTFIRMGTKAVANYSRPLFALCAGNGSAAGADSIAADFDYAKFTADHTAEAITIGASTKLKVAEAEPIEITDVMSQEDCEDVDGGFNFGNCNKGEYAVYRVNVEKSGIYDFKARMASGASETAQVRVIVYVDGEEATSFVTSGTGGWQEWVDSQVNKVKLTAGEHEYKVYFDMAGMNLNWIQMDLADEIADKALTDAVAAAEAKDISAYPAVRQEAYKKALESAKEALKSALTQAEIDAAASALKEAEDNLAVKTPITSLKLDAASLSLNPGTSVALTAVAAPADHTDTLVWSSSNPQAATVDANGVVSAIADGTAVITVSNGAGMTASVNVKVKEYDPNEKPDIQPSVSYIKDVNASIDRTALYVGGNTENKAAVSVVLPQGAKIYRVDYATSNPKAAIVNTAGQVQAIGKGSAVITAKVTLTNKETKDFTFNLTVKKAYIKKVKVPASVKKGKKVTFKAQAFGSDKTIVWSLTKSSKVGKITKKGKFTALKKGTVKVTATSGDVKKNFTIRVK